MIITIITRFWIIGVLSSVVGVLGLIGNTLSLIVLCKRFISIIINIKFNNIIICILTISIIISMFVSVIAIMIIFTIILIKPMGLFNTLQRICIVILASLC